MFKKIVWLWFPSSWKNAKDVQEYINSLVESGAWEFFVWYNPSYWSDKFGFEVSPNWRFAEHEQVTNYDTLEQIVKQVHKHKLEIFANLNAWYYTSETMPFIEKMVEEFIQIWMDWIICGNIWILEYLKKINYKWKINISTILAVYNKKAISFFLENYNVNKVILSREVTLKEIEEITSEFPEMNFEVFWEWDFCRYNNWLCFAEHKYWAKDICTVVVNDLVFKKRFRADFKRIILNDDLSNKEKLDNMSDKYLDIFEQAEQILWEIDLWIWDSQNILLDKLLWIVWNSRNRVDLFFDSMKSLNDKRNKDILIFLRAVKKILSVLNDLCKNKDLEEISTKYWSKDIFKELEKLEEELNISFKTYLEYSKRKIESIWWEAKLKALELATFYAKWDNLNLYSYLFFSKLKNVDTVKFPTRWRNYQEKINLIDKVLKKGKIDEEMLDRSINLERAHYDLSYLFDNKLWFREMLKNK